MYYQNLILKKYKSIYIWSIGNAIRLVVFDWFTNGASWEKKMRGPWKSHYINNVESVQSLHCFTVLFYFLYYSYVLIILYTCFCICMYMYGISNCTSCTSHVHYIHFAGVHTSNQYMSCSSDQEESFYADSSFEDTYQKVNVLIFLLSSCQPQTKWLKTSGPFGFSFRLIALASRERTLANLEPHFKKLWKKQEQNERNGNPETRLLL